MSLLPIDEWVRQLAAIPEEEFTTLLVNDFIQTKSIDPETLAPYVFYAKSQYTRNLIYSSGLFEVLTICWDIGQMSPPHDHGGQNCWMVMPIGRLRVQNFRVERRDSRAMTCQLTATNLYDLDAEHPAFVEQDQAVHQVSNPPEFGERAASIHVYSRPYSICEVYNLNRGVYSTRELSYWSKYGKPGREGHGI